MSRIQFSSRGPDILPSFRNIFQALYNAVMVRLIFPDLFLPLRSFTTIVPFNGVYSLRIWKSVESKLRNKKKGNRFSCLHYSSGTAFSCKYFTHHVNLKVSNSEILQARHTMLTVLDVPHYDGICCSLSGVPTRK
jgi:hypothetical protein